MMNTFVKRLVISASMAAIIAILTGLIKISMPGGGYINLGDSAIYLAAWLLGGWWAAAAAAIGSALADLFLGYGQYAPATFIIKGAMALLAWSIIRISPTKMFVKIIAMLAASMLMIAGYFTFEYFVFGSNYALLGFIPNLIQAAGGVLIGIPLLFYGSKIREISRIHKSNYHM